MAEAEVLSDVLYGLSLALSVDTSSGRLLTRFRFCCEVLFTMLFVSCLSVGRSPCYPWLNCARRS